MSPIQIAYIIIPFLWGEWLRRNSGLPWLVIVAISSFPADPLQDPRVVSYLFINLIMASLINVMDAVAQRKAI